MTPNEPICFTGFGVNAMGVHVPGFSSVGVGAMMSFSRTWSQVICSKAMWCLNLCTAGNYKSPRDPPSCFWAQPELAMSSGPQAGSTLVWGSGFCLLSHSWILQVRKRLMLCLRQRSGATLEGTLSLSSCSITITEVCLMTWHFIIIITSYANGLFADHLRRKI